MELAPAPAISVLQRDEGGELLPTLGHREEKRGVKADRATNLFWKCILKENLGGPFCVSRAAEVLVQPGSHQDPSLSITEHHRLIAAGETPAIFEAGGCGVRMRSPAGAGWRGCV